MSGMLATKKLVKGLKLCTTDIDWSWSDGAEVVGEAAYIILTLSGRRPALNELEIFNNSKLNLFQSHFSGIKTVVDVGGGEGGLLTPTESELCPVLPRQYFGKGGGQHG